MSENLREQLLLLPAYFQGHLLLTLAAITMGVLISVPLGVWAEQSVRVKRPLLACGQYCTNFSKPGDSCVGSCAARWSHRFFASLHRAYSVFHVADSAQHSYWPGVGLSLGSRGGQGHRHVAASDFA